MCASKTAKKSGLVIHISIQLVFKEIVPNSHKLARTLGIINFPKTTSYQSYFPSTQVWYWSKDFSLWTAMEILIFPVLMIPTQTRTIHSNSKFSTPERVWQPRNWCYWVLTLDQHPWTSQQTKIHFFISTNTCPPLIAKVLVQVTYTYTVWNRDYQQVMVNSSLSYNLHWRLNKMCASETEKQSASLSLTFK